MITNINNKYSLKLLFENHIKQLRNTRTKSISSFSQRQTTVVLKSIVHMIKVKDETLHKSHSMSLCIKKGRKDKPTLKLKMDS